MLGSKGKFKKTQAYLKVKYWSWYIIKDVVWDYKDLLNLSKQEYLYSFILTLLYHVIMIMAKIIKYHYP